MAKNWTVAEAVEAILNNDKNGIADFGKRFAQATNVITRIAAQASDGGAALQEFANALPAHVTMRKIDSVLKDGVEPVEDEDVETSDEDEAPAPKKAKRGAKSDEEKKAAAKARREARKAKKAAKVEEPEDDEEEEADDYSGMNAVDLYKLCKKRGIKAAPKLKAAEYVKLLKAADAKVAEAEDDADDIDWEDEPVEKPKAKRGRPAKKKAEPEPEEVEDDADEDEDDDWDI